MFRSAQKITRPLLNLYNILPCISTKCIGNLSNKMKLCSIKIFQILHRALVFTNRAFSDKWILTYEKIMFIMKLIIIIND